MNGHLKGKARKNIYRVNHVYLADGTKTKNPILKNRILEVSSGFEPLWKLLQSSA